MKSVARGGRFRRKHDQSTRGKLWRKPWRLEQAVHVAYARSHRATVCIGSDSSAAIAPSDWPSRRRFATHAVSRAFSSGSYRLPRPPWRCASSRRSPAACVHLVRPAWRFTQAAIAALFRTISPRRAQVSTGIPVTRTWFGSFFLLPSTRSWLKLGAKMVGYVIDFVRVARVLPNARPGPLSIVECSAWPTLHCRAGTSVERGRQAARSLPHAPAELRRGWLNARSGGGRSAAAVNSS
jgi:hypothetical protein